MIAFLRGRVLEKHPNRVIVDVGGVGYDVAVPLSTFYAAGDPGTEMTLRIHTHVREDQLALYGFATSIELTLFERLIAVSGIGPKLALAVISGMEARDLVAAIQRGDVVRLTRIPGVGKKTAERIVVELRDRLAKVVEGAEGVAGTTPARTSDALRDDLVSALENLGYHRLVIEKALERMAGGQGRAEALPFSRFEDALRSALKEISRG